MTLPAPQPTPWQTGTGLDPARTALVVVDVLGGPNPVAEPLRDMAANAVRLARAARAAGVPVVFACDAHLPGTDLELALWGEHSMRGTPDSRPLDAFEAGEGDYIIPKRRYDAFFGTDLDITLRELGRDTLVVVGFDTNICVLHRHPGGRPGVLLPLLRHTGGDHGRRPGRPGLNGARRRRRPPAPAATLTPIRG